MKVAFNTYIALLRGINVGGNVKIVMAELRELVTGLGLGDVRTLLQSGNLIFTAPQRSSAELETLLEAATETRFGHRIDYFVRSATEWDTLVRENPFANEAERDPARLVLVLLKETPAAETVRALQGTIAGREVIFARERCAYVTYPDGQGSSRFTNAAIERGLRTRATARNWNTVLKLVALAREGVY